MAHTSTRCPSRRELGTSRPDRHVSRSSPGSGGPHIDPHGVLWERHLLKGWEVFRKTSQRREVQNWGLRIAKSSLGEGEGKKKDFSGKGNSICTELWWFLCVDFSTYAQIRQYFCVSESVSGWDEHTVSVHLAKQISFPSVGGGHPIPWGPEKNKRQRMEEFVTPFFFLLSSLNWNSGLLPLHWDLYHWLPGFSGL